MKTLLDNVLLPPSFNVVNKTVYHCYTCLRAYPSSKILLNIAAKLCSNAVFTNPEQVIRLLTASYFVSDFVFLLGTIHSA